MYMQMGPGPAEGLEFKDAMKLMVAHVCVLCVMWLLLLLLMVCCLELEVWLLEEYGWDIGVSEEGVEGRYR